MSPQCAECLRGGGVGRLVLRQWCMGWAAEPQDAAVPGAVTARRAVKQGEFLSDLSLNEMCPGSPTEGSAGKPQF